MHERRDANEAIIVAFLRACGAWCVRQPRESGFDLLVLGHGNIFVVEIKDGPSARLTPHEEEIKREIEARSVTYWIIHSEKEAAAMLGVTYHEQASFQTTTAI